MNEIEPIFFSNQQEWHDWLLTHHEKEIELYVGFYKVGSNQKGIKYAEAAEESLCFGWIEAVRQSLDTHSWMIRFIRRKPNGIWSNTNIEKAQKLIEQGKMQPAGLQSFENRNEKRSGIYANENEPLALSQEFLEAFTECKAGWDFFYKDAQKLSKIGNPLGNACQTGNNPGEQDGNPYQ